MAITYGEVGESTQNASLRPVIAAIDADLRAVRLISSPLSRVELEPDACFVAHGGLWQQPLRRRA